jgi:RNA polymerase sigma factor (sigma-70 family)
MPHGHSSLTNVVRQLGRAAGTEEPDRELVERFARDADGAAFDELVKRHRATVWGVCRRLLNRTEDAEDAVQATFLVLARRAPRLRTPDLVGAWLYGVARRVALRARSRAARERDRVPPPARTGADPLDELSARELLALLDEELLRLPDDQRAALILCCVEGKSREEAAQQLGWSVGSVKGRLERGRDALARRLSLRGVSLSAALSAVLVWQSAAPALAASGSPSAAAVALADQVTRALAGAHFYWKVLAAALVLGTGIGIGVALVARAAPQPDAPANAPVVALSPAPLPPALPALAPAPRERVGEALFGDITAVQPGGFTLVPRKPGAGDDTEDGPRRSPRAVSVAPDTRVLWGDRPATPADLRRGLRVTVALAADGRTAERIEIHTPRKGGKPEGKEPKAPGTSKG